MVNVDIDALVAADLPAFKRLLAVMEAKYPIPVVSPGMSLTDIMYTSGQYSVVLHFREVVSRVESDNPLSSTVVN